MNIQVNYKIGRALEKIENSCMHTYNKRKALEYYNEKIASGLKKASLLTPLRIVYDVGVAFPDKKFEEISKHELMSFFNNLKPKNRVVRKNGVKIAESRIEQFSDTTIWQYKYKLRAFYSWLFECGEDTPLPEQVKWIKGLKIRNEKYKKEVLTASEAYQMVKAAQNPRDKAAISILWEYGLRASELLGMKKSDLTFHDNYIEFEAEGKTGKRDVYLVESKPFLEAWLAELEQKKDQLPKELHDFIWVSLDSKGYHTKALGDRLLTVTTLNLKLKTAAKRAGITKRVWTHGFRHSAATRDAVKGWNESQLKAKYGWARKSDMPATYVHFASENLKKKILQEKGLWKPSKKEELLETQTMNCPFCSATNIKENDYCAKCGKPLHMEQIKKMGEKAKVTDALHDMIRQELEKKGIDLAEMTRILTAKATNTT